MTDKQRMIEYIYSLAQDIENHVTGVWSVDLHNDTDKVKVYKAGKLLKTYEFNKYGMQIDAY